MPSPEAKSSGLNKCGCVVEGRKVRPQPQISWGPAGQRGLEEAGPQPDTSKEEGRKAAFKALPALAKEAVSESPGACFQTSEGRSEEEMCLKVPRNVELLSTVVTHSGPLRCSASRLISPERNLARVESSTNLLMVLPGGLRCRYRCGD